ncbi:hypothetical protein [Thermococcus sp.]
MDRNGWIALFVGLLVLSGFTFHGVRAGEPNPYWVENIGNVGWLAFHDVIQLDDGSIVAVGSIAQERGNNDAIVVKFSPYGTIEWAKVFGGPDDDYATGVTVGPNGDLIVVGATKSFGTGGYDVWVIRLYPDGKVRWQRAYGGAYDDRAMAVTVDNDGKIIVVGGTTSFGSAPGESADLWVLKLSGTGDVIWSKVYGRSKWDWGNSVVTDSHDDIYIGGVYWLSTSSPYDPLGKGGDGWIVKLDPNGNVVWDKTIGDVGDDWISKINLLGNDILFVGGTQSFGAGGYDVWVGRLNASGDIMWVRTYGGDREDVGTGLSVFNPYCGFIAGYTYSSQDSGSAKAWLISFSPSTGELKWAKTYGGPGDDFAFSLWGSPANIIAVGATSSFGKAQVSAWILKLSTSGTVFTSGINDTNFVVKDFKGWTYQIQPPMESPVINPISVTPKVTDTPATPREVYVKLGVQYYYGPAPPTTTTTTTTTSTTSTTTSTPSQTSTTTTVTSTTTTTITQTSTSTSTASPTFTSPSPTLTSTLTSTSSTSSSGGGGICGPGLMVLLGVVVLVFRRRL